MSVSSTSPAAGLSPAQLPPLSPPVLAVRALSHRIEGTPLLKRVSLEAQAGELLVLQGPSGVGKTTLLRLLAGLSLPDAGEITVLSQRVDLLSSDARARLRRSSIGWMGQELELLPHLDVARNVAIPLLLLGLSRHDMLERVEQELHALELSALASQRAEQLSRGQAQQVALARALVTRHPLMLLDEPTASLDPLTRDRVLKRLLEVASTGVALVVTSHDPRVAAAAHRRLVLNAGRLEPVSPPSPPSPAFPVPPPLEAPIDALEEDPP